MTYQSLMSAQSSGSQIVADAKGCPIAVAPPAPTIGQLRNAANIAIDAAATEVDQKYLTCGGQQGQIYAQKIAQANAYKAANYPGLADPLPNTDPNYALYGYIRAERDAMRVANAAAMDQAAADTIIAQANYYALAIGIERERLRRIGKEQVNAAQTPAAVQAAQDQAEAALRAL